MRRLRRCSGGSNGSTGGTGYRRRQLAQRLRRCNGEQVKRLRKCSGSASATMPLSAGKCPNPTSNLVNEHKNPDFVLGKWGNWHREA